MDIRNIKDKDIIKAISENTSLTGTLKALGLSGTCSQYKRIRSVIDTYDIDISHHRGMSEYGCSEILEKLETDLTQKLVNDCDCYVDIMVKLGLFKKERGRPLKSAYYSILKNKVEERNIDTSHFSFSKGGNSTIRYNDEDVFVENSNVTKQTLKSRYLKYRESLDIPYQCDIMGCKLSTWHDKELNLQLDHANGINNDNRIENLRLLCSNCHSQTVTFGGRKKQVRA